MKWSIRNRETLGHKLEDHRQMFLIILLVHIIIILMIKMTKTTIYKNDLFRIRSLIYLRIYKRTREKITKDNWHMHV